MNYEALHWNEICLEANRKMFKENRYSMCPECLVVVPVGSCFFFGYFLLGGILHNTLNTLRLKAGGISFFTPYSVSIKSHKIFFVFLDIFQPMSPVIIFFKVILLHLVTGKDKNKVYIYLAKRKEKENGKQRQKGHSQQLDTSFSSNKVIANYTSEFRLMVAVFSEPWPHHKVTFYFLWARPL